MNFVEGKWYQNSNWDSKKDYGKYLKPAGNQLGLSEVINNGIHNFNWHEWYISEGYMREVPLEEIQQYLPKDHPDRLENQKPQIKEDVGYLDKFLKKLNK